MPTTVQVPGVGTVRFPDSMSEDQILAKVRELSSRGGVVSAPAGPPPLTTLPLPTAPFQEAAGTLQSAAAAIPAGAKRATAAILPVLGTALGGGAGGALLGRLLGPTVGPMLGEVMGGAGAEGLNQATGLTPPNAGQMALQGAAPLAGRALGGLVGLGLRQGAKLLPGARAAAQEGATAQAGRLVAPLAPSQQVVDDLYNTVGQFNPKIPTRPMAGALATLKTQETLLPKALQDPKIARIVKDLDQTIQTAPGGELHFQALRGVRQRLGDLVGAAAKEGGPRLGALKLLRRSLDESLEAAAAGGNPAMPAVQALREATSASRKAFAAQELAEVVEKATGSPRPGDNLVQVNFGKILDFVKRDATFRKSIDPAHVASLETTLTRLNKLPKAPPPRGAMFGAGASLTGAGGVTGVGMLSGLDPTTASALGLTAMGAHRVLSQALMSETGRSLLLKMMTRSATLDHPTAALLAAFAASQAAGAPP